MNEVKLGIIGIGNMGSSHAKKIVNGLIKGLRLTAVCDIRQSRIDWAKENLPGVQTFDCDAEFFKKADIDAILVATPHYIHPEMAIKGFEHGLNVLVEKPAGVMLTDVLKINEAAKKSGKVFSLMWNQRTNPAYAKAKELVQNGTLGIPKRLLWNATSWYRTQYYYDSGTWRATWDGEGGGVLMNQAPHNLDLWQWIFGLPSKVRAFLYEGKYHNIEVEDDATVYAEYENGATAVFITTTAESPGTNRLEIAGDRGKIVIENKKLQHWSLKDAERNLCFSSKDLFPEFEYDYQEYEFKETANGHALILQNFTNAILSGEPLLADGLEGEKEMALCNAIYLSSWTNDWASLPLDQCRFNDLLAQKRASGIKKNIANEVTLEIK